MMSPAPPNPKSRETAAAFAFLLGTIGAHKFYLGYTFQGVILLAGAIVAFVLAMVFERHLILLATWIVPIAESFVYIAKSDEEFNDTYVVNKRPWF